MKKLLFTILLPLTMVCCQSGNDTEELQEIEQTAEVPEYNCLNALVSNGVLVDIFDYWRNVEGMDGYKVAINPNDQHHFYCFKNSEYTIEQMEQIIKDKY